MPAYVCPHCQTPFNVPAAAKSAQGRCPHCRQAVTLTPTSATRWYYARGKKKYGPYTWPQLRELAGRGAVGPDDMLLQEGAKQWVRAAGVPALFNVAAVAPLPAPASPTRRRNIPWLPVGIVALTLLALIGFSSFGYWYFTREPSTEVPLVKVDTVGKNPKPNEKDAPKPKNGKDTDKKTPEISQDEWSARVLERLNRYRKLAGLGAVALDVELSAGCRTLARELARKGSTDKADPALAVEQLAQPLEALDRWMAKLSSRAALLTPELQGIGLGLEPGGDGDWLCVLDATRGRGEPIVVVPAAKQTDVPLSFTGGPEVPDAKATAGFPISVTFPQTRKLTDAVLELRDARDKPVDGWLWTPEKPIPKDKQHNSIAFVPKGLLQAGAVYHARASAQLDGKAWSLAWSFTTEDDGGAWATKAIAKVNGHRAHAGLKPVTLDPALSRDCLKHARYLVVNEGHALLQGLKAHEEFDSLPGYSKEGNAAGKASVIAIGDYEPIYGVDSWMATLYHRVPILEPNLQSIGFACARGNRLGWVTVMNTTTNRAKGPRPQAVFYPADGQQDVPLSFPSGGEEPNPIPDTKSVRAGFPITATFPENTPVRKASASLTDAKGNEVPCWFSAPDKPANSAYADRQGNTVCLIPKAPLAVHTTYHVEMQGQLDEKPWQKKWKFTTGEAGQSVKAATGSTIDRLNLYRVAAGLGTVELDEKLSLGCQLHAEYLVKNADLLLKRNDSVNDEDVNLPGFTREGLQAAQSSIVFTNAPDPVVQIEDLMAAFSTRVYLLDPALQRVGFGCANDVGRGWRCVLDVFRGRGDSRVVLYPAPKQDDVPTTAFEGQPRPGFPISVHFPRQATLGKKVQAVLKGADGKETELTAKVLQNIVSVQPNAPLQAGATYSVTVAVLVNGTTEWRETWQFTTAR